MSRTVSLGRRDFLKAGGSLAAFGLAGCCGSRWGFGEGGFLSGFRVPPMERIRVGVVGCGNRGRGGVSRFCKFPCVEVTALCDIEQNQIDRCQNLLSGASRPKASSACRP